MQHQVRLTTNDMRGALRLSNELHDLSGDPLLRRRHLLSGLCSLVGADVGIATTHRTPADGPVAGRASIRGTVVSVGWRDADAQRRADQDFRDGLDPHPMVGPMVREALRNGWSLTTRRRTDVFDNVEWSGNPVVRRHRDELGIGDCVASMFPLSRGGRSAWIFLFLGARNTAAFTPRQRELLHVIHGELDWMYRPTHTGEPPEFRLLTVRQRQTLYRLLAGDSEKQVAAGLGLSRHTIHVHVKSLYKTFKVNTRNELLARFVRPPTR